MSVETTLIRVRKSYKVKVKEGSDNVFPNYAKMLGMSVTAPDSWGGLDSTAGGLSTARGFDGLVGWTRLTFSDGRLNSNEKRCDIWVYVTYIPKEFSPFDFYCVMKHSHELHSAEAAYYNFMIQKMQLYVK